MEEYGKGKRTVGLTVIGVATLMIAVIGATYAYFTVAISNTNRQNISVTTETTTPLKYTSNGAVSLTNAIPGTSSTSTFTVKNEDAYATQTYDLTLNVPTNTFVSTDGTGQLYVKVTATTTSGGTTPTIINSFNSTNGKDYTATLKTAAKIVEDQTIAPGETQTYTITVSFKELNKAQDTNQGATFSANITASDPKTVS